jgi:tetratricopeptide (TPR) repeat protein
MRNLTSTTDLIGRLRSRSHRSLRLSAAAGMALIAVALLATRIRQFSGERTDLLTLSAAVDLQSPPGLPAPDLDAERVRIQSVRSLQRIAASHRADTNAWRELADAAQGAGDLLTARIALQQALTCTSSPDAEPLIALAAVDERLGRINESRETLERAVSQHPDDWRARMPLVTILGEMGEQSRAETELVTCARSVGATNVPGLLALAAAYDKRYDTVRALDLAQAALRSGPSDPGVTVSVAGLLLKLHRFNELASLLRGAIAQRPNVGRLHRLMAQCLSDPLNPSSNTAEAESHFLYALQRDPADSRAAESLAQLYLDSSRPRQAVYVLNLALDNNPRSAPARMLVARALAEAGDSSAASTQKAIAAKLLATERAEDRLLIEQRRRPADANVKVRLSELYEQSGEYRKALEAAEAAVVASPSAPTARKQLAGLCRAAELPIPAPYQSATLSGAPLTATRPGR